MADYVDKYTKGPLTGKNVGVIFGKVHTGIALGTGTGAEKNFTFTPSTYGPFYPMNSTPDDLVATEDDIVVYVDGVAVTVDSFTPETGVAVLHDAPGNNAVVTGDCCEQLELYMAQNVKLTGDRETVTLDRLRCNNQRETYVAVEFTFTTDFQIADLETLKFIFAKTATQGCYQFPDEPVDCCVALIIDDGSGNIDGIIYGNSAKAKFGDVLNVSAGTDAAENSLEITFSTLPKLVDVSETT